MTPFGIGMAFNLNRQLRTLQVFFGLAQFLSTLALLVVVFNVSDFRYRYRLYVTRFDIRKGAIRIAGTIAAVLMITEIWFQNSFLVPRFLNHYSNIKLILAAVFLALVIYIVAVCFGTYIRV